MESLESIVFVVDDELSVRRSLFRLISGIGFKVLTFATAAELLSQMPCNNPSCLLLDMRMPETSGLELQSQLAEAGINIPIVFVTGYGTVPLSVEAMKAGAVDFIEKPFDDQKLLDAINEAIKRDKIARTNSKNIEIINARLNSLTPREHDVFSLVVQGFLNKQIAHELKLSEKTVKAHRGRVMKKMQAKSLADLVRMAEKSSC